MIDRNTAACSGREGLLTRSMMFDIWLLALHSARGRPPPEVSSPLDSYGIVHGRAVARSFLHPRLSPSARGFSLSSARYSLPRLGESLRSRWMNNLFIDVRLRPLVEIYYLLDRCGNRHTGVRPFLLSARGILSSQDRLIIHR